jgi:hypothetical protein
MKTHRNGVTTDYNGLTTEDFMLRADPSWYVSDGGHEHVMTVLKDNREIRIFRDGEMRIHVWDSEKSRENNDHHDVVRYTENLTELGIETDEQLFKADEDGRMEWHNNAWFDMYAYKDGTSEPVWLDCVQDDLRIAWSEAINLLSVNSLWSNTQ